MKLNKRQIEALTNCIGEALAGLGIADDCDELVAGFLEGKRKNIKNLRKWAADWDIVIDFYNHHVPKKDRYRNWDSSDPWVSKEAEEQIKS